MRKSKSQLAASLWFNERWSRPPIIIRSKLPRLPGIIETIPIQMEIQYKGSIFTNEIL